MRLEPLYRVRFEYPEEHGVGMGPDGHQERYFVFAEGRCEGRVTGRFRGANHPDRETIAAPSS